MIKTELMQEIIHKQDELIQNFRDYLALLSIHDDSNALELSKQAKTIYADLASLKSQLAEAGEEKEFHVWVIPDKKEIYVEDRGGGFPVGAEEHLVFINWDDAFNVGKFLAKVCGYELNLDNEAGRFAESWKPR